MKKLHLPQLLSKCCPTMHCSPHSWDWIVKIGMRQETVSSDSELYGRPSQKHTTTSLFATFGYLPSLLSQPWLTPSTGVRCICTSGTDESAGCASSTWQKISDFLEAWSKRPTASPEQAAAPHTYPLSVNTEANSQPKGERKVVFVYHDCFV